MSTTKGYASMSMSEDSGSGKKCGSSKPYVLAVACFLVLAVVAIIGLGIGLGVVTSKHEKTSENEQMCNVETECDSDSCGELASLVLSRMDQTVDPCVNFYNFTCGSFDQSAVAQGM